MAEIERPDSGETNVDATRGMSYSECRIWLDHHSEGELGYIGGRGPRSVVGSYAVTEDQILFLVPAYNEITQYVPGKQVTLQGCWRKQRTDSAVLRHGERDGHREFSHALNKPQSCAERISWSSGRQM
jgi:hypothetical protein